MNALERAQRELDAIRKKKKKALHCFKVHKYFSPQAPQRAEAPAAAAHIQRERGRFGFRFLRKTSHNSLNKI